MQVWDIVKVTKAEHELADKAGVVIRFDAAKDLVIVKLDDVPDSVVFAENELAVLGR